MFSGPFGHSLLVVAGFTHRAADYHAPVSCHARDDLRPRDAGPASKDQGQADKPAGSHARGGVWEARLGSGSWSTLPPFQGRRSTAGVLQSTARGTAGHIA